MQLLNSIYLHQNKYCLITAINVNKYIAVKLMCGSWRRALFVRKLVESYVKAFYLDYGFADENIMEKQMDQISTISISKTCNWRCIKGKRSYKLIIQKEFPQ